MEGAAMEIMLEFRAGIAILSGGSVTPDPRKGMLRVAVIDELVHFQWLNRVGKAAVEPPELDIVIFPEEASVTKARSISHSRSAKAEYKRQTKKDLAGKHSATLLEQILTQALS